MLHEDQLIYLNFLDKLLKFVFYTAIGSRNMLGVWDYEERFLEI